MRRILTAVITAIEAGAVALTGLVLVAIPGILLWVITFELASEPSEVAAAVSGVWLLGHGVPLDFTIDAPTALSLGLAPEVLKFTVSLAPLGLALIAAGTGANIGFRLARRGGAGAVGLPAGVFGFAAMTLLPVSIAGPLIGVPVWVAIVLPTLFFTAPAVAAYVVGAAISGHEWWHRVLRAVNRGAAQLGWMRSHDGVATLGEALRLAAAALAMLLGIAALGVGVSVIGGYAQIVTLSQQLQTDPIGAIITFVLQLALLPIAVIWALAWFTGAGFSIGAGSSVTPFETLLAPLPALPIFGAVPPAWGSWGTAAVLLVVLGALVAGVLFVRARGATASVRTVFTVLFAAVFVGLAVAGLASLATGSIGPGRLDTNGPEPWLTGGLAAAEVCIGLALGMLAGRLDLARGVAQTKALADAGGQRVRGLVPLPGQNMAADDAVTEEYHDLEFEPLHPVLRDSERETAVVLDGGQDPAENFEQAAEADTGIVFEAEPESAAEPEREPEIESVPETEADAEEALVRAYSWDDATVIDTAEEPGEEAPAKTSWWRRPKR